MATLNTFKIHLEPGGAKSFVELNGERLPFVRDVYVDGRLNAMPLVHVTFLAQEIDVEVEPGAYVAQQEGEPVNITLNVTPSARDIERAVARIIDQQPWFRS